MGVWNPMGVWKKFENIYDTKEYTFDTLHSSSNWPHPWSLGAKNLAKKCKQPENKEYRTTNKFTKFCLLIASIAGTEFSTCYITTTRSIASTLYHWVLHMPCLRLVRQEFKFVIQTLTPPLWRRSLLVHNDQPMGTLEFITALRSCMFTYFLRQFVKEYLGQFHDAWISVLKTQSHCTYLPTNLDHVVQN